jgi:hypothetical protein
MSFVRFSWLEVVTIQYVRIRRHASSACLFKRLAIEPFDTFYNRRLLRWTGHISRMPLNPSPKKNIELLGRQSSTSQVPTNKLGPNSEKGTSEHRPSN